MKESIARQEGCLGHFISVGMGLCLIAVVGACISKGVPAVFEFFRGAGVPISIAAFTTHLLLSERDNREAVRKIDIQKRKVESERSQAGKGQPGSGNRLKEAETELTDLEKAFEVSGNMKWGITKILGIITIISAIMTFTGYVVELIQNN